MNIAVKNLQIKVPIPCSKISTAVLKASRLLRLKKKEVSIVFVGSQRMQSLNRIYLGHDYVTDVITFDLDQEAEIIICPAVAKKNAALYSQKFTSELLLYIIHGLLHLAGYDDHSEGDIKRIRIREQQLLDKII